MFLSKHLKYIVRILVWSILGLHIGLAVLLNIPVVQGELASLVSAELRKLLKTEVSVGHIIGAVQPHSRGRRLAER